MKLDHFPTDDLASRCAQESSKQLNMSRDDRFCFELLRRAFGMEDHYALGHTLNIYKDVWSRRWVHDTYLFENQFVTMDDFKSIAFYQVYDRLKGGGFDSFPSLSPV